MRLAGHRVQEKNFQSKEANKTKDLVLDSKQPIPVPLNKVGTLPIEIEKVISTVILDSEAGVSISTKTIWEKWEKPVNHED